MLAQNSPSLDHQLPRYCEPLSLNARLKVSKYSVSVKELLREQIEGEYTTNP